MSLPLVAGLAVVTGVTAVVSSTVGVAGGKAIERTLFDDDVDDIIKHVLEYVRDEVPPADRLPGVQSILAWIVATGTDFIAEDGTEFFRVEWTIPLPFPIPIGGIPVNTLVFPFVIPKLLVGQLQMWVADPTQEFPPLDHIEQEHQVLQQRKQPRHARAHHRFMD
mgnify:CR=1 FL=1